MRRWVIDQLRADGTRPVVVIDHKGIATVAEITAALGDSTVVGTAKDWFELRQAWEHWGRNRGATDALPVIVVSDPAVNAADDLPFDVEQSATVFRLRVPGGSDTEEAILAVDPVVVSDIVVKRVVNSSLKAADAVLTALADMPPTVLAGSAASQFRVALRMHEHPQPSAVVALAQRTLTDPLALALLSEPPLVDEVQTAWEDWVSDPAGSNWLRHFDECGAEVAGLLLNGTLTPLLSSADGLPAWATVGLRSESHSERVAALLTALPSSPTTFEEWTRVAEWWGEVRSNLALINPTDEVLSASAWTAWSELDQSFQRWLREAYGSQLTRSWMNGPISLDKVQPFLATRLATSRRILLIVLDGMGFAQWTLIRERARLRIVRASAVLAMLPTLTEVSRQAIAAGALPSQFVDSLGTTSKEQHRWIAAWADATRAPVWTRVDGAHLNDLDEIPIGATEVIGVVLSATDELMHTAELLGDLGLHASVDAWIKTGVLDTLIARGGENGYETWITADHGNLASVPTSAPREGAFVERAGSRLRRYATKTLRDEAAAVGLTWDDLPGFPQSEAQRLLFAPGRIAWGPSRVSHGGLSLDEVIVPFVQVEPT